MKRIDCDVFMKDGDALDLFDKVICITGNFYGGKDCANKDAFLGNEVSAYSVTAGGDIISEFQRKPKSFFSKLFD